MMRKLTVWRIAIIFTIAVLFLPNMAMAQHVWHSYNGHVYALTLDWKPWFEAEAEAHSLGGHLVAINDAAENEWLVTTFSNTYARDHYGESSWAAVLIGYHYDGFNWVWSSGEPVTYTNHFTSFPQGGIRAYLHVSPHAFALTWNANPAHTEYSSNPSNMFKGVIELPVDTPPETPLVVTLTCDPSTGVVPFSTTMRIAIYNLYPDYSRRIAAHVDATIANGQSFSYLRSGYTNAAPGEITEVSWGQTIPSLGTVIGGNVFDLVAEDVTPPPYNMVPFPPSGNTATSSCTVTASAP